MNIVDLVRILGLKPIKSGKEWKVVCPFHKETRPSMSLNASENLFHCFGCGASGNIVTFYMRFNNITNKQQAIQELNTKYGFDIKYITRPDPMREFIDSAHNSLLNNPKAMKYLEARAITQDTLEHFKVGYIESHDNPKSDEAIVLPIMNAYGRYISYSLRRMGNGEPRYLHVNLKVKYSFFTSGLSARKYHITEGQFDVLSLYELGYDGIAALGGAGLSDYQIDILRRITDNFVIVPDNDKSGIRTLVRLYIQLYKNGINPLIRIVNPKYKDLNDALIDYVDGKITKVISDDYDIVDFIKIYSRLQKYEPAWMTSIANQIIDGLTGSDKEFMIEKFLKANLVKRRKFFSVDNDINTNIDLESRLLLALESLDGIDRELLSEDAKRTYDALKSGMKKFRISEKNIDPQIAVRYFELLRLKHDDPAAYGAEYGRMKWKIRKMLIGGK